MCGIVGYIGSKEAKDILIEGLKRLEYRGYDSAGIAMVIKDLEIKKSVGKIKNLQEKCCNWESKSSTGIAHTRWATHGAPTENNAHPHTSCDGKIALVHNGIIENYSALRSQLIKKGHQFKSETDTEVLVHLIEDYFTGDLKEAVIKALASVEGTYGIAVVSSECPDKIVAARNGSPLVLGVGKGENFIASDVAAILSYTDKVIYLDDKEVAEITINGITTCDIESNPTKKEISKIDWDLEAIEKGGFDHFMLKEIHDQPQALRNGLAGRIDVKTGTIHLGGLNFGVKELKNIDRIVIAACGTSWHAGLLAEFLFENLVAIPTEVEYASEFRYRNPVVNDKTLLIVISQSGETADTLAALREAKGKGAKTLGIINVVGSTIAREVDGGMYIHAGPEIGVASTKAFSAQVSALLMLALHFGRMRNLSIPKTIEISEALLKIPDQIETILKQSEEIKKIALKYAKFRDFLYLGRNISYPVALEGALKLKEISYIHAEGYPSAEMKHGPIALIDPDFPSVFVVPKDSLYEKVLSNMEEIKARSGKMIAVATEGDKEIAKIADDTIYVP
ncbi:MAG: Isomerizing Glutamine-fructose-6-phosphate aminotransferase, partial [candidate division CPR2 bacterium GW2011_GWD1_39_7]